MKETADPTLAGNHMKTSTVRMNWLIPLLGVVLLGGGFAGARSYLGFEQQIGTDLEFQATIDRIGEACDLLQVQRQFHNGGCPEAARRLDECLSASVVTLNRELASPDEQTQVMLNVFFEFMARHQSQRSPAAASLHAAPRVTELGAQKIVAQTLASASLGN
jgi:hypothetical protein